MQQNWGEVQQKMPRSGFDEKLDRLKALKSALEKGPLTFDQAKKLIKGVNERMVNYYLRELCELDVAAYDPEAKVYRLKKLSKIVFESKNDYMLALEHSKKLLFSTPERQLFDLMNPFTAIDQLAFYPERYRGLIQHLKTGYFQEFWLPLQKYRQLMEKYGYPEIRVIPPPALSPDLFGEEELPPSFTQLLVGYGPTLEPSHIRRGTGKEEEQKKVDPQIEKQLSELKSALVGRLQALMYSVEQGLPLLGYCDFCPHLKITIKDANTS